MNQKMSKAYKIFGPSPRGIETIQGRNAQISMSMVKRYEGDNFNQITNREQIISPFMGYNASDNNLAYSQVSEVNIQLIRRVAKEQLEKLSKELDNKNQHGVLRTEIRSLKQLTLELEQKIQHHEEQRQQSRLELDEKVKKMISDYQQESLLHLKKMFEKMSEYIKKQVSGQLSEKFEPSSFVDVVHKEINELEDRIILLQSKIDGDRKHKPSQDPVILAETIDLRLKKVQRQMESIKKSHSELLTNVRQEIEPNLQSLTKQSENIEQNRISCQRKLARNNEQLQQQIKRLFASVDQLKNQNYTMGAKLKTLKEQIGQKGLKLTDIKDFVINSQNMTTSGLLEHQSSRESTEEKLAFVTASNERGNERGENNQNIKQGYIQKSPKRKQEDFLVAQRSNQLLTPKRQTLKNKESTSRSAQQRKQKANSSQKGLASISQDKNIEYRIDNQNRLLDQNNSYILDEKGQIVILSNEQIQMLRKSQLVVLQE